MALISVVQGEVVERKKLIEPRDMLDGITLATLLPGPIAVNVVAYVGYRLRGAAGAIVSAVAVILPAFILIITLSAVYFRWAHIPEISKFFLGFVPAVVALIAYGAWGLARQSIPRVPESLIAAGACLALLYKGGPYITAITIALAGVLGWLMYGRRPIYVSVAKSAGISSKRSKKKRATKLLSLNLPIVSALLVTLDVGTVGKLFVTVAGISLLLFGGGYVLIPLLEQTVVHDYGWLTRQELADAIALSQITPGPIAISVAFIGYKVMGLAGALIATVAMFLPPAVLMLISSHFLMRLRESTALYAVLRGIRPAVVGMICTAAISIATTAAANWQSVFIFCAAAVLLLGTRASAIWIIPGAGLTGLLIY